jgi:hypothetical protein
MPEPTVTRLRPRELRGYTDSAALNDIHALLTTSGDGEPDLLGDIAQILARTGRPMMRSRDIEASVSPSAIGWPVARVDAEDTSVTVRQDPADAGLLIEITTRTAAERDSLTITLDGRCLHHAHPPGGRAARPARSHPPAARTPAGGHFPLCERNHSPCMIRPNQQPTPTPRSSPPMPAPLSLPPTPSSQPGPGG